MDDVVRIDTVPPPDVLDRIMSESRAVVVTAPIPARGALVTIAVERGVPCVTDTPIGVDPERIDRARRARGGLVPRVPGVPLAQLLSAAVRREKLPDAWRTQLATKASEGDSADPDWLAWASRANDSDPFAALGLAIRTDIDWRMLAAAPADPPLALPRLEEYAFERGLKPALYLTLPRDEAARVVERFASYEIATIDYDLEHDAVLDRRLRVNRPDGEGTHRDVFVANEAETVEMARRRYLDPRGPSEHLEAMGRMLGYPACCIAAFDALDDRSNNTALRYAAWKRTRDLGYRFDARLDNVVMHLLPWFPCSYACARSVRAADELLASLRSTHASIAGEVWRRLARPVLYFDHARSLAFEGATLDGGVLRYRGVVSASPETSAVSEQFARSVGALFAAADTAHFDDPSRWTLERAGEIVARIDRAPRASGFLFPFEAASDA